MANPERAVTTLEARPASLLSSQQLAELANQAFTGYIGNPISMTAESVVQWIEEHYISLEHSYVYFAPPEFGSAQPVAFGLIALRGKSDDGGRKEGHARLASMGVVPDFQGKRVGGLALKMLISAMKDKEIEVFELECIRENVRGVKLYEKAGFEIIQELAGWERDAEVTAKAPGKKAKEEKKEQEQVEGDVQSKAPEVGEQLQECQVQEVSDMVNAHGAEDLPWQLWGFSRSPTPKRAFHLDSEAYCVVTPPDEGGDTCLILCVFVRPEHRGKGASLRLAKAMFSQFPTWKWQTKVILPVQYGEKIAERTGFKERAMRLYQMRLRIR